MTIYYDGGYSTSDKEGAWAVVAIDDDGNEHLLEYGYVRDSKSSEMEMIAASHALKWARRYECGVVYGDFVPSLRAMKSDYPDISWKKVSSKGNPADKFAKVYNCL